MWQTQTRKRMLIGVLSVLVMLVVSPSSHNHAKSLRKPLPPPVDLTGVWKSGTNTMQVFQTPTEVTGILVNKGFAHLFRGKFEDSTTLVMSGTRRNRVNGCVTEMKITITVLSQSQFKLRWLAIDSKCDLKEGQMGKDADYVRQL